LRTLDSAGARRDLGLWITRVLVEAHGGRIRVESTVGHGAAFLVELPRRLAARPAPTHLSPSAGRA
jgi:K+-sensing histidine kinase KdpD